MSARWITATTAAKRCAVFSIWDIRQGLFLRRREWSGCRKRRKTRRKSVSQPSLHFLRKRKHRVNIHGNIGRGLEGRLQFVRHLAVFLEPVLRAGAVACRFGF